MSKRQVGRLNRYFVPDLTPMDRPGLKGVKPKFVFVAESPHLNEIEPDTMELRRPLCGMAGRQWWRKLGEILDHTDTDDVSLERMVQICRKHRIAILNAVQFPMDPKIAAKFPEADPARNLGFGKLTGDLGYKKMKDSDEVKAAIQNLRKRLTDPALSDAVIWPLGGDAQWFVSRALSPDEFKVRVLGKVHHPSAWWRKNKLFGRIADQKLREILR